MCLHHDRRRLDVRAFGGAVFRIGLAREIALGPAIVSAVLDDVDVFGREVITQVVAVVVAAPQLASRGIERQADAVAEPAREDPSARAVGVELRDGRAHRVTFVAEIARGPRGDVELAVRSEQNRARRMAAALRQARDRHGIPAWLIEPFHVAFLGDVHGLAAKRDPERPLQSLRDDDGAVGDAVVVRIGELDDEARARLRRVDRVAGTQREITDALELVREDRNREPGRQPEGIIFSPTSALGSHRRGSATPENEHGCYDGAWPHRLSPTHDGYSNQQFAIRICTNFARSERHVEPQVRFPT